MMKKFIITLVLLMIVSSSPIWALETSCSFLIENTKNNQLALLDYEEVGFKQNIVILEDRFGYKEKLKGHEFLKKHHIVDDVAGYLSLIHFKIPELAEHLLDRVLNSKIILDNKEEFINNESCFHDMLHLESPILINKNYVVVPYGMISSDVYVDTPSKRRDSIYYVNENFFNKLNNHYKVGAYLSLISRDYLLLSKILYKQYGIAPRNFNASLAFNLKLSEDLYFKRISFLMNSLNDVNYGQMFYSQDFISSFDWKPFTNERIPNGTWTPFWFFPRFHYVTYSKSEMLSKECVKINNQITNSIKVINGSLNRINSHIKDLLVDANTNLCRYPF